MKWKKEGPYLALKPSGRLDALWFTQWAETVLDKARETSALLILVDLENTYYASSAFLRFLILLHKETAGKQVMLISPHPSVMQVLEIAGFDAIFHITANTEEALVLWHNTADSRPAVKEEGIHSEFTSNGYFHFSGNLPSTAHLLQRSVSPRTLSTAIEKAGLSPSRCVGAGMSASNEGDPCALFLGEKIVFRNTHGPVRVVSDTETTLSGEWPEFLSETVVFDRLDDTVDFGCRWPDKGILFSELAFDVLRLARERRTDPGRATGFLMIHDHPDKGCSDTGDMLHICSGLIFGKEDLDAFSRLFPGTFVSEKGVVLCGVSLDLSVSGSFDFSGSDVFRSANRLLGMATIRKLGPLNPHARVGKMAAALTCFSKFIQ